jgi:uncharacterized protein YkwD
MCAMKRILAVSALALLASANDAGAAANQADGYAAELGKLINDYRTQHGLQPLALVAPLSELAHEQAARMARENRLSHEGFQDRFAKARSPACVENVGSHDGPPEIEFAAWRDSPTHAHNLLDPRITRMGIAIERSYVAFFACR